MKAKEVLLLIFIVVVGVGLHYLENLKLTIDDWEVSSLFRGESYLLRKLRPRPRPALSKSSTAMAASRLRAWKLRQ